VRDALFLSAFQVQSLPLMMGASAVIASPSPSLSLACAALALPSRPAAAALSAGSSPSGGRSACASHAAAVGVYLQVAAAGGALVSGFWSLVNERFDPTPPARSLAGSDRRRRRRGRRRRPGLAGVRAVPLPATVLGLVALGAFAAAVLARAPGPGTPLAAGVRARAMAASVLLRSRYSGASRSFIGLGAVVEAIVDFLFKAETASRFAAGSLLGVFAAFHGGMSVLTC